MFSEFTERQWFRNTFLVFPISISIVFTTLVMVLSWYKSPAQDRDLVTFSLVFTMTILLQVMIIMLHLDTRIDNEGIHIRFFPFLLKEKTFLWTDINACYPRKYKPMREYGGWGIRYSRKYGRAYNVWGDYGLQLNLKNGKRVLIGTQKYLELEEILKRNRKIFHESDRSGTEFENKTLN